MKKVIKLKYNWRQTNWDGEAGEDYDVFEIGQKGVISIEENEIQCYHYAFWFLIKFEDGTEQKVFNPNQVFYN